MSEPRKDQLDSQRRSEEGGFQSQGPESEAVLPALSLLNLSSLVGNDRGLPTRALGMG